MHAKSTGGNSSPLGRKRFSLQSVQERPEAGWMRHPLRTSLGRSAWTRTGHSSSWIIGTIIPATVSQSRACTAALSLHVFPAHATCHLLPAHLLQEGSDRASRLQSSVTSSCQPPPAKAKIAADSQHGVELVRGFGFLLSNMRSLRLERSAQGSCAGHPDLSCSWRCHWARRHGPQHVLFRSSRT